MGLVDLTDRSAPNEILTIDPGYASAARLHRESQVLRDLVRDDGLRIVAAEYDVETGIVEFLEEPPDAAPAGRHEQQPGVV